MKQIEVTIMGNSYVLGCPEGGERLLQEAVARVDREMCAIRDAGKIKARERIAVLAALNLAYALAQLGSQSPTSPNSHRPASDEEADAFRANLDNLLRRLDTALEQDGHLL
ncbi:MAG: cell division protein ZapA [Pseudomonadota bacterium]